MKRRAFLLSFVILASIPLLDCKGNHEFDMGDHPKGNLDFTIVDNSVTAISGQSFLNFSSQISPMSLVNATWFAEIVVLDSYGVEFLENRSSGLRHQIDTNLGNSDNWISLEEADAFATLAQLKLNWTDTDSNICCVLDDVDFLPSGEQNISVSPPIIGPVDLQNSTWGWIESVSLHGLSDGRTQRILDLPRIGEMVEEVPMTVNLPEDWEIKFSPMAEIISGSPRNFTVHRSLAPVAYDIRITLGENTPPSLLTQRFPNSMSNVSLDKTTFLTASCTDGFLESPEISWIVEKNDSVAITQDAGSLDFTPMEYDFSHGDSISFSAICTDSHGSESSSTETLTIDSMTPELSWEISTNDDTTSYNLDETGGIVEVPAGWELTIRANTSDNSGLPVIIDLFSNISEGWYKAGINQKDFHFTVNQGILVNGAHLSPYDRHQQREESVFAMSLQITDDAGNTVTENWQIRVTDTMQPTIIMNLESGGIERDLDDGFHYSEIINASLSESFDDIDAINKLTWGASIDSKIIFEDENWSQIEKFPLPSMDVGIHEIYIWAIDSSGNRADSTFQVNVHPKRGVNLTVLGTELSTPDPSEKSNSVFVTVQNEGSDKATLRLCIDVNCSRYYEVPGATIDLRNPSVQLQLDLENTNSSSVEGIILHWDSGFSSEYGQIPIEINSQQESQPNDSKRLELIILIFTVSTLALLAKRANLRK